MELTENEAYFLEGKVVNGFKRGSKELGFPTANFESDIVNNLPEKFALGVYFGWAQVENDEVRRMVMSLGYNPFYNNKEKSLEVHILHKFSEDFYGLRMKICIAGYLRPEKNFSSSEELINAIEGDISQAERYLNLPQYSKLKSHDFFK